MNLLDLLPNTPVRPSERPKLTSDHKIAILQALKDNQWTTAREAYGWAWNQIGVRVTYVTFWRFLNAEDLFEGDTLRSRKLRA